MPVFTPSQLSQAYLDPQRLLYEALDQQSIDLLRQLLVVLPAPVGSPRIATVLITAAAVVARFGALLKQPHDDFVELSLGLTNIALVAKDIGALNDPAELHRPLQRSLSNQPWWALALELGDRLDQAADEVLQSIGAWIATSLLASRRLPKALCTELRRALGKCTPGDAALDPRMKRRLDKIRLDGIAIFETDGNDPDRPRKSPRERVLSELKSKMGYAAARHHQGVLDHRHQTSAQMRLSGRELIGRAQTRDHSALQIILAYLTGLSQNLVLDVPFGPSAAARAAIVCIDLQDGLIRTNLGELFPGAADPGDAAGLYRPSTWISVVPLPKTLHQVLQAMQLEGGAETVGALIPDARATGEDPTISGPSVGIRASVARFLRSAAPFAIDCETDRLVAAVLTGDFGVAATSGMYYASVQPQLVWDAAERVFHALGWGEPMPMPERTVRCGSRVVPTREALSAWFAWMVSRVHTSNPGRHATLDHLIAHHNDFTNVSASLVVLCLALRETRSIGIPRGSVVGEPAGVMLLDKAFGAFTAERPVAICDLLRAQFRLWAKHVAAFERRLVGHKDPGSRALLKDLRALLRRSNSPLLFTIAERTLTLSAPSSADVRAWWPNQFRFEANFGRHVWATELLDCGAPSRFREMHLRHALDDVDNYSSTTAQPLAAYLKSVSSAQDQILGELGFAPIPGLVKK